MRERQQRSHSGMSSGPDTWQRFLQLVMPLLREAVDRNAGAEEIDRVYLDALEKFGREEPMKPRQLHAGEW
jgi:hypothetical protein